MRVLTFDVPPQEVKFVSVLLKKESYPFLFYLTQIFDSLSFLSYHIFSDPNKRLSHCVCGRYYVLQGRLNVLKAVFETSLSNCLMCLHTNERPMLSLEIQWQENDITGVQRHIMYSQRGWLQSKHKALGSDHIEVSLSESHHNVVQQSRNVLGTKNLGDILSERESIAHDMQVLVKGKNCDFFARNF